MAAAAGSEAFVAASTLSRHSAGFPSPRTPDLDATTRKIQSKLEYLKPSPSQLWGEETVCVCIYGNPWAGLFAGKSGSLPLWALDTLEGQEWLLDED